MNAGFVGLGVMGRPMALNLLRARHALAVFARRAVPDDLLAAGGVSCASPADVARRADAVITMVPATADVEAVLFGDDGIVAGLRPGAVVVDMSSIDPGATRAFAVRVAAAGGAYVDAPVSGGEIGARDATLAIMCGGSDDAVARVRPLLAAMGRTVTHVGPVGDGQTAKVANQIAVALTIEAVAEALHFAARAGADPARVREAMLGGFAASRVLEVHGARMLARDFAPGARIALHRKDLDLALAGADALGVALPGTALVRELFDALIARGGDAWDHAALIRALEARSGEGGER